MNAHKADHAIERDKDLLRATLIEAGVPAQAAGETAVAGLATLTSGTACEIVAGLIRQVAAARPAPAAVDPSCPPWCTGHITGRDAITRAATALHIGAAVTVRAGILATADDDRVTVTPRLLVTEPSAALDRRVDAEVRIARRDGHSTAIVLRHAEDEARWMEQLGAPDVAAAVREAAKILRGQTSGTWPNGEPATVRAAADEAAGRDGEEPEPMMPPSQILDAAADVIERNGLHHGDWVASVPGVPDAECPVCTGGAINLAAIGLAEIDADDKTALRGTHRGAFAALARRLDPNVADTTEALIETVAGWNDRGRGDLIVVAELRAAAADEREKGR